MKTLILAALAAALVLPASAPSQAQTGSGSETGAAPGNGGEAGGTGDKAGSYTIVTVSNGELNNDDDNSSVTAPNRNTSPAAIQRTVDANPGLAEKLAEEGVALGGIGAISVEPNGRVVIYDKP